MAFCPTCGSKVGTGHRFCGECGETLPQRTADEQSAPESTEPDASEAVSSDRELEYDIDGLGDRVSRSDVEEALNRQGVPFTWDGGTLVVGADRESDVDEVVRTLTGDVMGPVAPTATGSAPATDTTATRRRLLLAVGVAVVAIVVGIALFTMTSDDQAAHEQICELTEDFWRTVDEDENRTQFPQLLAIAREVGDGLDDQAEEEGFDEIAGEATRAGIGANFADETGDPDVVFTAFDNLAVLCEDLGLFDESVEEVGAQTTGADVVDEPATISNSDARSQGVITLVPPNHPVDVVIAAESRARLPDDPFVEIDCSFDPQETPGATSTTAPGRRSRGGNSKSVPSTMVRNSCGGSPLEARTARALLRAPTRTPSISGN